MAAASKPPRIGLCRTYLWNKAQPETREAVENAAATLTRKTVVIDVEMPGAWTVLSEAREVINNYERARALAFEWQHHRPQISPQLNQCVERGLATPHERYVAMQQAAQECRNQLPRLFADVDLLIAPAVNGEAPEGLSSTGDPSFQGLWTLLRTPAMSLPAHRGPNGLPVGIQLIAPQFADAALFENARWVWQQLGNSAQSGRAWQAAE
jgi:amidase